MLEFQKRVIEEKKELDEKINKLFNFIYNSGAFTLVEDAEQDRMRDQFEIMNRYSQILGKRIKNFK